jgi:ATP-dependent Clp protease adaptor protein ClpS
VCFAPTLQVGATISDCREANSWLFQSVSDKMEFPLDFSFCFGLEFHGKMSAKYATATIEPDVDVAVESEKETDNKATPKRQPRFHVVLWDDDDHSYDYVIAMMQEVFRFPRERGYQIARMVDRVGKAICLTTTKEHAELKRDQIHAYGRDGLIARCKGSMSASIEPEC